MGKPIEQPIIHTLGEQLRALRKKAGLTGYRVNQLTGVATSFLSRVELGKSSPSVQLIQTLAPIYHADPAPLLKQLVRERFGDSAVDATEADISDDGAERWVRALVDIKNLPPAEARDQIQKAMGFLASALAEIDRNS